MLQVTNNITISNEQGLKVHHVAINWSTVSWHKLRIHESPTKIAFISLLPFHHIKQLFSTSLFNITPQVKQILLILLYDLHLSVF